jgi:hypothetical protein
VNIHGGEEQEGGAMGTPQTHLFFFGKVYRSTSTVIVSCLLFFIAWVFLPAQALQTDDTRQPPLISCQIALGDLYAVVVGISRYSHPKIPKLTVSDKDARDFADFLLTQKKLFRNVHLTLLCNEKAELGNSLFTYFLIKGLRGEADTDGDGVVTIKEVYDYVYEKTKEATSGVQHPQMEGRLLGAFPVSRTVNVHISLPPDSGARPSVHQPSADGLKPGEYFVEDTNPNGTSYRGKAVISQVGERYEVTWNIAGKKHFGKGVLSGNVLYINWGTSPDELDGIVTYSM